MNTPVNIYKIFNSLITSINQSKLDALEAQGYLKNKHKKNNINSNVM